jgi:hypothetical protein
VRTSGLHGSGREAQLLQNRLEISAWDAHRPALNRASPRFQSKWFPIQLSINEARDLRKSFRPVVLEIDGPGCLSVHEFERVRSILADEGVGHIRLDHVYQLALDLGERVTLRSQAKF